MIVKLSDGKEYLVKWHHRLPRGKTKKMDRRAPTDADTGGTSIFIEQLDGENRIPVCETHLTRYYKDEFSKEAGRKYSLTQALTDCGFDRKDRKKFWNAYWERLESAVEYNVGE